MLVYQDLPPVSGDANATIVGLHSRGGDVDELAPLCRDIHPALHIVLPQAMRPVNAPSRVYTTDYEGGYRWCFGDPGEEPEPATYGESLWNIEQFVYDVKDRLEGAERPIILLGRGQGALVALTMGTIIPDWLGGVVAIDGYLPVIRGWTPPVDTLDGLPILLVNDPQQTARQASLEASIAELQKRQGVVTTCEIPNVGQDASLAVESIRGWLNGVLATWTPKRPATTTSS
jgi:predicted esterase